MKVRIVKHTEGRFSWYKNQIGSIFNVDGVAPDFFILDSRNEFAAGILKSDCEILPEENQPEPFDLERASNGDKIHIGNAIGALKFSYCDGNFKHYCFLFERGDAGYVLFYCSNTSSWHHTPNGSYFTEGDYIKMAPRESEYVTKWVNLYAAGCATWDHSQQEAIDSNMKTGYGGHIGTFPITFKRPS